MCHKNKKMKIGAVSLFTREWIEIAVCRCSVWYALSLPLYEGVD